jgi:ribosomal protein L12E/L44/L45/RPP1/RPP2
MWNSENKNQIAFILAAVILNDKSLELTKGSLKKIINTAGVEVEEYWFGIFERIFKEINFSELIGNSNKPSIQNFEDDKKIAQDEVQERKSDSKSDEDMGLGLFD